MTTYSGVVIITPSSDPHQPTGTTHFAEISSGSEDQFAAYFSAIITVDIVSNTGTLVGGSEHIIALWTSAPVPTSGGEASRGHFDNGPGGQNDGLFYSFSAVPSDIELGYYSFADFHQIYTDEVNSIWFNIKESLDQSSGTITGTITGYAVDQSQSRMGGLLSGTFTLYANAAVPAAPTWPPPIVTVQSYTATTRTPNPLLGSSLATAWDPEGNSITAWDFWDSGTGGSQLLLNGQALVSRTDNYLTSTQVSQQLNYRFGAANTSDVLYVRAYDGTTGLWSAWASATEFGFIDKGPVTTPKATNFNVSHGQALAASSLFTSADPDGDQITQYAFWDTGAGGGHFVLNGVAQAINQEIDISAAQLAQMSYQGGSGADTLWVRANDGTVWGAWSSSFTVTAPIDTGPVLSVANLTVNHGQSVAGSSLFTSYSDPFGNPATQYHFWNTGSSGGQFMLNGVALPKNQADTVTAAQLSQLSYQSGSGADTLWVQANDGTVWGPWSNGFTVTAPVDTGPVLAVQNVMLPKGSTQTGAGSLFTYSDPFGDAATQYDLWDTGVGGGRFVFIGAGGSQTPFGTNQHNIVTAVQLASVTYQPGTGGDTLWIRANDGTVWGNFSSAFTVSAWTQTAPVVTASHTTATHAQSFAASSLFSATDLDGDTITQFAFWDTGSGGGHFVLNGVALLTNQEIDVPAAQLAQLTYQSGSGADTLWVRANDGTQWGAWSTGFTVTGPIDAGPTVTASNQLLAKNQSTIAAASLFSASDADGDTITAYDFWDTGAGGGHFLLNGSPLAANQHDIVTAAQLAQLTYQAGSSPDTLWVRANDGFVWGNWTSAFTVSAWTQTAPVVTASHTTATHAQSFAASSLFSATDLDGDTITQFAFWDTGSGGGHFVLNGVALLTNQEIDVPAAQLAQLTYQSGSGADTLWVRANDGTQWGAWSTGFTVTGPIDAGPTVTAANQLLAKNQSTIAAASLFSTSDAEGDAIASYDFWDTGAGGGHFLLNGSPLAANQHNIVTAPQLAQVTYRIGSSPDTLWVRANDGFVWGNWSSSFTVSAWVDSPPVVVVPPSFTTVQGQSFPATLISASDPDGDAITQYDFWNLGTSSGHFLLNGQPLGTNQDDFVQASQLAQTSYVAGPGTDTLWVRASDGSLWNAWQSFKVTALGTAQVGSGAILALSSNYAGPVTFVGSSGTLLLLAPLTLGTGVSGYTGQDALDFRYVNFASVQTPVYSGNAQGGTLTISDGTHTGSIPLTGDYLTKGFVSSSDGQGGTLIRAVPFNGPVLSSISASAAFTQGGAATVLAPNLTVADADNTMLAGATIAITGGRFSGDGDVLTATTGGLISAIWSRTSETLILSGTDTLAAYQQVLRSITFSTSSVNPTDFGAQPTRTITWTVNDGGASNNLSVPASTTVTITPVIPPTAYSWVSVNDPAATGGTTVAGINGAGQIVGAYQDGTGFHGFLDTRGLFTTINDPSGTNTYVQAINASGQIVGYYAGNDGRNHGFIDSGGSFQTLDDPAAGASGSTYALGIDDAGDIVGYYYDGSNYYGFLESGGSWSKIDDPLAAHNGNVGGSSAYAINSAGQIAGLYRDSSQIFHAFVDNSGGFITIDEPNAGQSGNTYGAGLNDRGQVVGFYTQNGAGSPHGFVDNAGNFTTLDDPSATSGTSPAAISGSGQIVGTYYDGSGPHGFVATPTSVTVASGAIVVLPGPYAGTVNFAGATGTLLVDTASSFAGTVAGQLAIGDVLDFADITAGANATIGYTGNNSPGTLTVSDGTHAASVALLGNYSLANFVPSSDGYGGTRVVDPPVLSFADIQGVALVG